VAAVSRLWPSGPTLLLLRGSTETLWHSKPSHTCVLYASTHLPQSIAGEPCKVGRWPMVPITPGSVGLSSREAMLVPGSGKDHKDLTSALDEHSNLN
jgi:hypothetical protein